MDLDKIRKESDAKLDPEWLKKYGDESWKAALALIGEPPDTTPNEPKTEPPPQT